MSVSKQLRRVQVEFEEDKKVKPNESADRQAKQRFDQRLETVFLTCFASLLTSTAIASLLQVSTMYTYEINIALLSPFHGSRPAEPD